MNSGDVTGAASPEAIAPGTSPQEELVFRVASSRTFEKSPRLRAFFLHVCQCALQDKAEDATEHQIGIRVYERPADYNPNEDNIVRSQARLLRMKLESHFAGEGKNEPFQITIPKGRYLPVFEPRSHEQQPAATEILTRADDKARRLRLIFLGVGVLFGLVVAWLAWLILSSGRGGSRMPAVATTSSLHTEPADASPPSARDVIALPIGTSDIRIAAGRSGAAYVDARGRRWDVDRYFEGGMPRPGPQHLFPPTPNDALFKTMREATSGDAMVPQWFRYAIPLKPGVYELRLYFADPLRETQLDGREDAQNRRHFQIDLNGHPLLSKFDPVADSVSSAVDVRVFRDISPGSDGMLHLDFAGGERPFVNAIEVTPGTPGKLRPIRIRVQQSDFVDRDGVHWSGDDYFVGGRTSVYRNPETGPMVPPLYTGERHGTFSYAIPVAPGTYTVRLHFMESFFSPLLPAAGCRGAGCRVFDVTCNGVMLLRDFDISQDAAGAFRPTVREFHGLRPNGQGKLLLSFSSTINYAEVRAIEVLDEGK